MRRPGDDLRNTNYSRMGDNTQGPMRVWDLGDGRSPLIPLWYSVHGDQGHILLNLLCAQALLTKLPPLTRLPECIFLLALFYFYCFYHQSWIIRYYSSDVKFCHVWKRPFGVWRCSLSRGIPVHHQKWQKSNLHFLYMGLHLYRSKPHKYMYDEGPPLLYKSRLLKAEPVHHSQATNIHEKKKKYHQSFF